MSRINKLLKLIANKFVTLRGSLNNKSPINYVEKESTGLNIPKVVHQTYYTKLLPFEIEANINKMKTDNPDWEFRLYDDQDIEKYISKHFPNLLKFYKKIDLAYGAARADFFRYLVIYKEGGVYLDIKSGTSLQLNKILKNGDKYLLSNWPRHYPKIMLGQHRGISNPIGEYQQWYIISVKGHPFLEQVINNVCNNIVNYNPFLHDFGSWGVFNLTGPIAYSEAIFPIINNYEHTLYKDHLAIGLEYIAISTTNTQAGHQAIFKKTHYSKLIKPVVKQNFFYSLLFTVLRPCIVFLKKILKSKL
jgi:mannosyltransferase OCH1-like enzyme